MEGVHSLDARGILTCLLASWAFVACDLTLTDPKEEPPEPEVTFVDIEAVVVSEIEAGQPLAVGCRRVDSDGLRWMVDDDPNFAVEIEPPDAVVERRDGRLVAARAGSLTARCRMLNSASGGVLGAGRPTVVQVRPGPPRRLTASLSSAEIDANESVQVTCSGVDAFGNTVTSADATIVVDGVRQPSNRISITRAGTHDVRCDRPGATAEPMPLVVRSAAPHRLEVRGPGVRGAAPAGVDDEVTFQTVVYDRYGNVVDGVDVSIDAVEPAMIATPIGGASIVPLADGIANLSFLVVPNGRRWPGFSDLTTIIETVFGRVPGRPVCEVPADGAQVSVAPGAATAFEARVVGAGMNSRVFVDDDPVELDVDGRLATTVVTSHGLNLVEVRVENDGILTQRVVCAFHAGDTWLAPDASSGQPGRLAGGIATAFHPLAFDDRDASDLDSIADIVRTVLESDRLRADMDAVVASMIPTSSTSTGSACVGADRADVCGTRFRFSYGAGETRWQDRLRLEVPRQLEVRFVDPPSPGLPGSVVVEFGLGEVAARVGVDAVLTTPAGSVSKELLTAWASWGGLDLRLELAVSLDGGAPRFDLVDFEIPRFGAIALDVEQIPERRRHAVSKFVQQQLLGPLVLGLELTVEDLLEDIFDGMSTALRNELADRLEQRVRLERLDGDHVDVGGRLAFDATELDTNRLLLSAGVEYQVDTPLAFPPEPDLGVLLPSGPLSGEPAIRPMQPVGVSLHFGVIAQSFDAMWRAGLLETVVSTDNLPAEIPALPFTGVLETEMLLPPVLAADAEGRVTLAVGPIDVRAEVDLVRGRQLWLRTAAVAGVRVQVVDGALVLDRLGLDDFVFSVQGEPVPANVDAMLQQGMLDLMTHLVDRMLADAIAGPPLPYMEVPQSLDGYGVTAGDRLGALSPELLVTPTHLDFRTGFGVLAP